MSGLETNWRIFSLRLMDTSTGGPEGGSRCIVRLPAVTSLPRRPRRRDSISEATRTTTPRERASSAVMERLSVPSFPPRPAFRYFSRARDLIWAARSFVIFFFMSVSGASFPDAITGWAAPTLVPGAIAATWAA